MTHSEFTTKFNTNAKCIAYIEELRWGKKRQAVCVHCCSGNRMTKRGGTNIWHCNKCNLDSTVLLKSPMEHSRLPVTKWFEILYWMLFSNKNTSQISRQVKVPYKNLWYCCMRLKCYMFSPEERSMAITMRDDLRKFIKERGLSEKEQLRIGFFDKTVQELLSGYDEGNSDTESLTKYIVRKIKLRHKKLSRKYLAYYVAEYVYKQKNKDRRNLFGYFLQNAFV